MQNDSPLVTSKRDKALKSFLELIYLITMLGVIYGLCYAAYVYATGTVFKDQDILEAKGYTPEAALELIDYYTQTPRKYLAIAFGFFVANMITGHFKKRLEGKKNRSNI